MNTHTSISHRDDEAMSSQQPRTSLHANPCVVPVATPILGLVG